ncbi:MAG: flagellar filament capping protein FliD [Ignavibacteriaceae bacterium]
MSSNTLDTILTTSNITALVNSYITDQTSRIITPITTRQTRYQNLSSAYNTFSSKLTSLKSLLVDFKIADTTSLFNKKAAASSDPTFISTSVENSASIGAYNMRVDQLAKNDVLLSQDIASSAANALTGTHTFTLKTGDGTNPDFTSNVEVTFSGSETNQTVMEKIRNAINTDKAVVQSGTKSASASYTGGPSTFTIDLNGTETSISVNGGGTYEDLIDEIASKINSDVSGVSAEKVLDSGTGNVSLKLTVNNSKNYISVTNTSGNDIVSDLGIGAVKEKGASGMVTASSFSPASGNTQLSLTSKETGVNYRIKELSDSGSSTALSSLGLNIGASRPAFDQSTEPDTVGFLYSDISSNSLLNAKLTFNGLSISRDSNIIDDLVTGVTFNLKASMQSSDSDVSVSVANDVKTIESKVQDFITKFNDIYQFLKTNSSATSSSSSGTTSYTPGVLSYDSNASSLLSMLRSVAYTRVVGIPTGDMNSLSQIGITFDTSTGLSISDTAAFEQKVNENSDQVAALFNSTDGLANTLYNQIDPYLGVSGYLTIKKNSYNSNITSLSDKITAAQDRINKSADSLRSQYEKLQSQLAEMISMQNMISYL